MLFNPGNTVGLDFETYSATDLPKHGLERYVTDPTFRALIARLAYYDEKLNEYWTVKIDFVDEGEAAVERLRSRLNNHWYIAAHNAGFEQRVLRALGIEIPSDRFIDTAVVARANGAAGKLEAAAPQLLYSDKLESGKNLIKLFCVPGKYQEANDDPAFDPQVVTDHPVEWAEFDTYCGVDSELGLRLALEWGAAVPDKEWTYQAITMDMNVTGWPVDVATVEEMQRRYLENISMAEANFRARYDDDELNFNSLKQLKEWCRTRGIRASSFDEKNVAKLRTRIEKKLDSIGEDHPRWEDYSQVLDLLITKQILGGSSLKKLRVLLDTVAHDGRLYDQYLHVGAGQSYRTTGRGVQMQNLKRLSEVADMDELQDLDSEWDNDKLAENIRQCFTSSHPQGQLIVGDFSSVESRGLAWLAGANEKLDAFRKGLDIYKVGAAKQYGIAYDAVTKPQRQFGKVGELSCGYQAGGSAVQSFAAGMGVELTEGEANGIVTDYRLANPEIVSLWARIDELLHEAMMLGQHGAIPLIKVGPKADYGLRIFAISTPSSLADMHQGAQSLAMVLTNLKGDVILRRVFHGCYYRGRSVCYYKPTERKTGDVWVNHYTDPKTKQVKFFSIYGGKLAGILTQSFCREIFFMCLDRTSRWARDIPNLDLIGQFHDEIVLDWTPGQISLDTAMMELNRIMSDNGGIADFPLVADIKHDYRYTK